MSQLGREFRHQYCVPPRIINDEPRLDDLAHYTVLLGNGTYKVSPIRKRGWQFDQFDNETFNELPMIGVAEVVRHWCQ